MHFRRANRAQAMQVGAILIFGFLIVGLAIFQAAVVPEQNRQVEFDAYQETTGDVTEFRNDVLAAAGRDTTTGTTVKTGVEYPSRAFFVNPAPPNNRVETTEWRTVTLSNVSAVNGEANNTQNFVDVIDDASGDGIAYETRSVRFDPDYAELDGQSMVVSSEAAYRVSDDGTIRLTGQSLIRGNRINLVFIEGNVSAGGTDVTLTTEPISATRRTVTVTGRNGSNVELRLDLPPGLSADGWNESDLRDDILSNPNVETAEANPDTGEILVELDGSKEYRLGMARLEVREDGDSGSDDETSPAYVIASDGDGQSVTSGQTADVTAEVRDEFNNPVSGSEVEFEIVGGEAEFLDGTQRTNVTADAEGRATARLVVQGDEDVVVTATPVEADGVAVEPATFEVQVRSSFGSGSGSGALLLSFSDATADGPAGEDPPTGGRFQIRNIGEDPITITGLSVDKTSFDASDDDVYVSEKEDGTGAWNREIFVNSTEDQNGYYEAGNTDSESDGLSIGERANLTDGGVESQVAVLPSDARATVYLYQFRKGTGSGNELGTDSKFVEVTVYFKVDGEEEELSVTTTLFLF